MKNSLEKNKITSNGAILLFNTLKHINASMNSLNLTSNKLNDDCMISLGEYLQSNKHIKHLFLANNNNITDKGIEILSQYLIGNTTIKQISIFGNKGITNQSILYLINIARLSCIDTMNVYDTGIDKIQEQEIRKLFQIPSHQRETPIESNAKSAAKVSNVIINMNHLSNR